MNSVFSKSFVEQYRDKDLKFGPLGFVTHKRTYSRFIDDESRGEEWFETVNRVLTGNFLLEQTRRFELGQDPKRFLTVMTEQVDQAYDDMFNLRWLPSGRGLWCSGAQVGSKNGAALTNCYYVDVKPVQGKVSYPFIFAMDMLMLGAGVGFGVYNKNIKHIPEVKNHVDLYIVCDETHKDFQFLNAQSIPQPGRRESYQYVVLHDTREGWVYGLKKVIDTAFLSRSKNKKTLVIDISDIRASGEPIKGFGGTASGPAPLVEMLRWINKLLNSRVGHKLDDVDCTDIMNLIGCCVVTGNVRRSAMIALSDGGSREFIRMKNPEEPDQLKLYNKGLITFDELCDKDQFIAHHRWASNNSVLTNDGFDIEFVANSIWTKGEPGFLNLDLVQNYGRLADGRQKGIDGHASGTNPCGEISLESFEPCNLAEIFPANCESFEDVKRVVLTAYRYAKRVTLSPYAWPETREVVEKNRRIGVSISGIVDWILQIADELGVIDPFRKDYLDDRVAADLIEKLNTLYQLIKEEDIKFSAELEINESIKLTTVKPSGSISLLAGTSPGIHFPYAEYYIRRIQFQETDPMVSYLTSLGFTVSKAVQTPRAMVVQFPVRAATAGISGFRSAGQVSSKLQLHLQSLIQTYWADNQVSCTISLQKEDGDNLHDLIVEYKDKVKSTSFLPYNESLKDHYVDLPYEPISEKRYHEEMKKIIAWPSRLSVDSDKLEILNQEECAGGVCPIK